jgi:2-polyprenyl-3-methyl-5-hydroxy-6-metoxy-1,4-benzoquinol methylase
LIEKLVQNDCFVVYLSSNAVFSGEKQLYEYNDKTCPTNNYGKFKTEVEEYLTKNLESKSCILRLTKVIAKNALFIERWNEDAKLGKTIKAFTNKYLSPVDIEHVIASIHLLIEQKRGGIYQYGGTEEISFAEYAQRYFKNNVAALKLIKAVKDQSTEISYGSLRTHLPTQEDQYNELLGVERVTMGLMSGHTYLSDSKRLTFTLARYKFVSKMFVGFEKVLEVGCADAFGTPLVLNEVKHIVACDFDRMFIEDARLNHPFSENIDFRVHNMIEGPMDTKFEGVFSLDVLEHIDRKNEDKFMRNIAASLTKNGTCIIGMPSLESQIYASEISKLGHVNCKKGSELKLFLSSYFQRVFMFSMSDEVVHTGFQPMSQYLLALCCFPIE